MRPEFIEGDQAVAVLVRALKSLLELRQLIHFIGGQLAVVVAVGAFEAFGQHRVFPSVNGKREARQNDREKMHG